MDERTFGWMTRWRRLVRDCEKRIDVSPAMIHVAMIHVAMGSALWRRIVHRAILERTLRMSMRGLM